MGACQAFTAGHDRRARRRVAASVSPGDPLGIPTEAILAGERDSGAISKQNALTHGQFRVSALGEEALMSLSRTARRISLPALLAVVVAAALLAIAGADRLRGNP